MYCENEHLKTTSDRRFIVRILTGSSEIAVFCACAVKMRPTSHAGTVVPECFKDDNASQLKSGKFDPRNLQTRKPTVTKICVGD